MAISQNVGTTITALLPALFAIGRPARVRRTSRSPSARIALRHHGDLAPSPPISARETYRVHLHDLGHRDACPVSKPEYDRLRLQAAAQ